MVVKLNDVDISVNAEYQLQGGHFNRFATYDVNPIWGWAKVDPEENNVASITLMADHTIELRTAITTKDAVVYVVLIGNKLAEEEKEKLQMYYKPLEYLEAKDIEKTKEREIALTITADCTLVD